MIAAFDVYYLPSGCSAAALVFSNYEDAKPTAEFSHYLSNVEEYVSGAFFKRELPCILSLLEKFETMPDEMIVDAYVMLGDKPGLGQHLFEHFEGKIPVIGVAKSKFEGAAAVEICRGESKKPLYVTVAGMNIQKAVERIKTMHGTHRIPTLLKRVDKLARDRVKHNT